MKIKPMKRDMILEEYVSYPIGIQLTINKNEGSLVMWNNET